LTRSSDIRRILLIITRLDRGGSAELTLQLASGLAKRGYEVTLISGKTAEPAFSPEDYSRANGFRLLYLNTLIRALRPALDLYSFIRLVLLIRDIRPEVVHTNSSKAGILGRLAARWCGVRIIVHSPHGHIFYGYYSRLVSRTFIIMEKIAAHYSNRILNLTEFGRRDHIRERIAAPQKFEVSSCGIELAPFREVHQKQSSGREDEQPFTICWIGRFVPIKNFDLLIRAASILQTQNIFFRYLIAGDGELLANAKKLVENGKIAGFNFLGYRTDVPDLLAASDLFVLTSRNEGFGRVIVEAMACGLPVVVTCVGGVPELITDDYNGLLVDPDDAEALANALKRFAHDSDLRIIFGRRNYKKAEFYSADNYINRVNKAYINILDCGQNS